MAANTILKYLGVATKVLVVLFSVFILFFLVTSIIHLFTNKNLNNTHEGFTISYEVRGFGLKKEQNDAAFYSNDSLIRVNEIKDHYTLNIKPTSSFGYFALVIQTCSLGLSFAILWVFMKLFNQTNLAKPFSRKIIKQLKILALLFIISDLVKLFQYFSFGSFMLQSFTSIKSHFELFTTVGGSLITGLIIWIIAIIFQRGIELQEENALTV